jgi:hypothetical protein
MDATIPTPNSSLPLPCGGSFPSCHEDSTDADLPETLLSYNGRGHNSKEKSTAKSGEDYNRTHGNISGMASTVPLTLYTNYCQVRKEWQSCHTSSSIGNAGSQYNSDTNSTDDCSCPQCEDEELEQVRLFADCSRCQLNNSHSNFGSNNSNTAISRSRPPHSKQEYLSMYFQQQREPTQQRSSSTHLRRHLRLIEILVASLVTVVCVAALNLLRRPAETPPAAAVPSVMAEFLKGKV